LHDFEVKLAGEVGLSKRVVGARTANPSGPTLTKETLTLVSKNKTSNMPRTSLISPQQNVNRSLNRNTVARNKALEKQFQLPNIAS
jgi:hypothetical protein